MWSISHHHFHLPEPLPGTQTKQAELIWEVWFISQILRYGDTNLWPLGRQVSVPAVVLQQLPMRMTSSSCSRSLAECICHDGSLNPRLNANSIALCNRPKRLTEQARLMPFPCFMQPPLSWKCLQCPISSSVLVGLCPSFQEPCAPPLFLPKPLRCFTWPKYFNLQVMMLSICQFSPMFSSYWTSACFTFLVHRILRTFLIKFKSPDMVTVIW